MSFLQRITVVVGKPFTVRHLVNALRADNSSPVGDRVFTKIILIVVQCWVSYSKKNIITNYIFSSVIGLLSKNYLINDTRIDVKLYF